MQYHARTIAVSLIAVLAVAGCAAQAQESQTHAAAEGLTRGVTRDTIAAYARQGYDRGDTVKLTTAMETALRNAAGRWDSSLSDVDGRTVRGLVRRDLVTVTLGQESYYSRRKGWWVTRIVATDVKINDAGRAAIAGL